MSANAELQAIFQADRELRAAESRLLEHDASSLQALLDKATSEALDLTDAEEAVLRLERITDLCAQVPGPRSVDTLIRVLDYDAESVRVQAAEALVDVAFERYAEVARATERALDSEGLHHALRELPWVIVEVAEPSAPGLVSRFLRHPDAEVVASAIEALATLADPAAVTALRALSGDTRVVEVDGPDEAIAASIGDLASEAVEMIEGEAGRRER